MVTKNEIKKITAEKKNMEEKLYRKFCEDLVNAPEFAKRMNTSTTTIYTAIAKGLIKKEDIYVITGKDHWSWKKYKHLTFRPNSH